MPCVIEHRPGHAAQAFDSLFLVQRVALLANLFQFLSQVRQTGDGVRSKTRKASCVRDLDQQVLALIGQEDFTDAGTMQGHHPTQARVKAHRLGTAELINGNGPSLLQNRQLDGLLGLLVQFPQEGLSNQAEIEAMQNLQPHA